MEDKEKLNILVLSWRGPGHPHAGGAELSTHEHVKGWVKAGHCVTLFTSSYAGAKKEEVIDGVNIIRRGSQIFGVHWEAFKWYLFGSHPKFDLVVDQFHGIPFFTPLYVRGKKLAFIHEVTKEVWSLNPWSWPFNLIPTLVGRIFEPLIFMLLYKNIPFMTVSQSSKRDLTLWGIPEKNITVVHNGLDVPKIKHNFLKEKKKTLIFLGALSKDKGVEDVLKTFSILGSITNNFQFWIVGKGEAFYLKSLKLQASELKIDKKVKFWGFVNEEKKYELLKRAHLLINPSTREGWGFVVMEAASQGTPTIGYNVAGLRDSIIDGKTGILTDTNPQAMAKDLVYLINNKNKYKDFSVNCINWAESFKWEESVIESLALLKKLMVK